MKKIRALWDLSFSSKVLLPVLGSMVLLLVVTVLLVNRRLTRQFQTEAERTLATADAVFRNSQKIRTRNLLLRFRNLPNEPRYKAALQSGDLPTLREQIKDLRMEQGVDVALFTSARGEVLTYANRDPLISMREFQAGSAQAIQQATGGDPVVDTIRVGDRLFDVVSLPVSGMGGDWIGALSFGSEIGDEVVAQEFSLVTDCQIVLLANRQIIASTLPSQELQELRGLFQKEGGQNNEERHSPLKALVGKVDLREHHYFCSNGNFATLSGRDQLGYLLLSSYDEPLRALHHMQETLLLVSTLGILLGTTVVWLVVRRATRPLRALRDSAEAVGQGDFSRQVEVTSGDECGELACVFNQMTQKLKASREQLEQTVASLRTTQAQLVQSEKLSGIGEFVAGVAHELNNPLTSVMGFSELLKQADANPKHQRHLELIHKSALRCQKIVQNLLSFARPHRPERKSCSLNELVEATIEFLQYQLRTSNIEVIARLDTNLPKTMLDPHQVQQVLLNLLNNSRQAIEAHQPKGWVRITTEACGPNIRITFQDNGPGIREEHLSKLFDPFFTTKEAGKGTGLGLSLCYSIIREHGGVINARSVYGQGATFEILLPLAAETESPAPRSSGEPGSGVQERSGRGRRVLVIDDEEPILQMMRETLAQDGFQVDVARDGESALSRLKQAPYDLALCDWKMPGLTGQEVYERLRASNPALSERLIFITGDVINDRTQKFFQDCKKVCLSKPFSLTEFREAIGLALVAGSVAPNDKV